MEIITTTSEMRRLRAALPGSVAFVPTMGFLHEGHLALMREGLRRCDHLVVSIFVNPTQFGPGEDIEKYPRDPEGDAEKCRELGCDFLFTPTVDQIYAPDHSTVISVKGLGNTLCGSSRPGHFDGVTTVVTKFFSILSPDVAVFGQKDYQQLAIVRRMVRDLNLPVEIADIPTVREHDGLAMSSRNRYLDDEQRAQATVLSRALLAAHRAYREEGLRAAPALIERARAIIEADSEGRIDYLQLVDPHTMFPVVQAPGEEDGALLATAVFFDGTRLIDNIRLDQPLPKALLRARSVACQS